MSMVAVHLAKQRAHADLEVRVAARAAPSARRLEVCHRRAAERALRAFRARRCRRQLLLQKLAERMVLFGRLGFKSALRRALLAEMELVHGVVLDRRQMHGGVALVAIVAQHQGTTSRTPVSLRRPSSSNRVRSARDASDRLCVAITIAVSRSVESSANRSCKRSLFA